MRTISILLMITSFSAHAHEDASYVDLRQQISCEKDPVKNLNTVIHEVNRIEHQALDVLPQDQWPEVMRTRIAEWSEEYDRQIASYQKELATLKTEDERKETKQFIEWDRELQKARIFDNTWTLGNLDILLGTKDVEQGYEIAPVGDRVQFWRVAKSAERGFVRLTKTPVLTVDVSLLHPGFLEGARKDSFTHYDPLQGKAVTSKISGTDNWTNGATDETANIEIRRVTKQGDSVIISKWSEKESHLFLTEDILRDFTDITCTDRQARGLVHTP